MYRTKKQNSIYKKFKDSNKSINDCSLCNLDSHIVVLNKIDYKIIKNKFPYSYWENRIVVDHLMIVPVKHCKNLKELSKQTANKILNQIILYESKGYDIYARGTNSSSKSINDHMHIHLIKTKDKIANINISIEKPYFLFVK